MKFRIYQKFLLAIYLTAYCLSAPSAEKKTDTSKSKDKNLTVVQKKVEYGCNQNLLRSYLLKGREKSTDYEPFLVCPQIVNNCCTKQDQQRIYHIVNDILPARLTEYESKIKMVLARIKNFQKKILAAPPKMFGSYRRRKFCLLQLRNVINYPFNSLYQNLIDEVEQIGEEMKTYYETFFCILCDGSNHSFFEFEGREKKIIYDINFCRDFLNTKMTILRAFNVELVQYLINLQNLVDCTHYVRSFNLPFFDHQKVLQRAEITNCLSFIASRSFLRYCRPVCERLTLSKIILIIQGDFEFLSDASNLFEKFFDFKETGNFISTRLRNFFRRFVVAPSAHRRNRKLGLLKQGKDNLLVPHKSVKSKSQKLQMKAQNEDFSKRKLVRLWEKEENLTNDKKLTNNVENEVKEPRKLSSDGEESQKTLLSKSEKNEGELINSEKSQELTTNDQFTSESLNNPIFASLDSKLNDKRILAPKEEKPAAETFGKRKSAQIAVNADLQKFYNLIVLSSAGLNTTVIYQVPPQPIDYDQPLKTWSVGNGINPIKYYENHFNMTSHQFYRLLYNFQKREKHDVSLEYFLSDFSTQNFVEYLTELKTDFEMDPRQFRVGINLTSDSNQTRVLEANEEFTPYIIN